MTKRAAQERASAIQAMQQRHARGLLSDAEKVVLAEKMAQAAQESSMPARKEACTVQ